MAHFMYRARALRLPVLLAAAAGMALVSGCGGGSHKSKDTAYVAHDVESLYLAAKQKLDEGDFKTAAAIFDEVERQHPYSPWARRAQVMSAFSYYAGRDYVKSIETAQRFLSIHPGNKEAAYAYYLIAQCYYEQISDVTRDQKDTAQALTALNDVVRRYPDTTYATAARLQIDLVTDHLGGKEMDIGRFYERSGKWLAADIRFRAVVENYQTTSHIPEALYRLVETNLALGLPEEAEKYAAVLGANYPGSEWYLRAYKLIGKDTGEVLPVVDMKGRYKGSKHGDSEHKSKHATGHRSWLFGKREQIVPLEDQQADAPTVATPRAEAPPADVAPIGASPQ